MTYVKHNLFKIENWREIKKEFLPSLWAKPILPILGGQQNIKQNWVQFRKSKKSAKSLHTTNHSNSIYINSILYTSI